MIEGPAPETPLALQLQETALDHVSYLVRSRRLELPRVLPHSDLNAARLPIPPRPHMIRDLVGARSLAQGPAHHKYKFTPVPSACRASPSRAAHAPERPSRPQRSRPTQRTDLRRKTPRSACAPAKR